MGEETPKTQRLDAGETREQWDDVLDRVSRHETRVIVERAGVPAAAIVAADDFTQFARWEAQRREDHKILEAGWEAFKDVPPEEIEREVDRAVAEARAENRKRAREQAAAPTT